MLSISKAIKGARAVEYYLRLSTEDYNGNSVEQPGQWFGSGAELLGLNGEVERKPFRNLLFGFSPDGKMKLAQNAGGSNRQNGWDMTFSAVKDVSTFWSNAPEQIRKQVEAFQQGAVTAALRLRQQITFTSVGSCESMRSAWVRSWISRRSCAKCGLT
jgi:conjugative relaxase-like TrwC/TraI family protein